MLFHGVDDSDSEDDEFEVVDLEDDEEDMVAFLDV